MHNIQALIDAGNDLMFAACESMKNGNMFDEGLRRKELRDAIEYWRKISGNEEECHECK